MFFFYFWDGLVSGALAVQGVVYIFWNLRADGL